MDVTIIVVNYNTKEITLDCINSIFEKTKDVVFEVILVDNGSFDGSYEFFSSDKRITYIYNEKNLGFGKANNLGFKYAKGNYIFLLNSDTLLKNNAVKLFFDYAENASKNIACFGALLQNRKGDIIHSFGEFPKVWKILLAAILNPLLALFKKKIRMYDNPNLISYPFFNVDYITGADLFIRREVIEQFGLFDPLFFMYSEETDMQRYYASIGYERIIIDGPCIVHLEGESTSKKSKLLTLGVFSLTSQMIYLKKWKSPFTYYVYRISLVFVRIPYLFSPNHPLKSKLIYWKKLFQSINVNNNG